MSLMHIMILLPLIFAIVIPIIYRFYKGVHLGWFVLPIPVIIFIYFMSYINVPDSDKPFIVIWDFMPRIGMNFAVHLDGLSLLFASLITGIGALVVLYSITYLSKSESLGNFYCYLLMFMGAMLGVVLSDNLLMLYLFWELTSISSFLLIGYWRDKQSSIYGAQKSLLITVFGGLMLLGGFISLYLAGNSWSITSLIQNADTIQSSPYFILAMVLILIGAMTKSAQFPFHIWLPDAMEAPTPVSAYLHSATMVKAGIYLVARTTPIFAISGGFVWTVTAIGLITLFWASFNAVKQQDLKGILAFSTVSQLGMIMSMLGIGAVSYHYSGESSQLFLASIIAAVFHLINHATFKGALFMVTGTIDHEVGTRDIKKLGGLMTIMPISCTFTIITALSMAGVPPFNGFLSKELFLTAMFDAHSADVFSLSTLGYLLPIVAIVGSIFTFVYSFKYVHEIFFGEYKPEALPKKAHEAPILMLLPTGILTLLVVVFGLFPNILSNSIIAPAVRAIAPFASEPEVHISYWHGITPALIGTIIVFVVGFLLFKNVQKWVGVYDIQPEYLTFNYYYDRGIQLSSYISNKITQSYMTGFVRSYLMYIFAFFIIITALTLFTHPVSFVFDNISSIRPYELILIALILISTFCIVLAKSRLFSIIMLASVGYSVALFFVFFGAPDLALTQLSIETISTALFLLCFYHLPKMSRHDEDRKFKLGNFIISICVGIGVIILGLIAYGNRHFDSISQYYKDNVYDLAAGKNMVNVILVDFRGFDTLFESAVLGIAGLGIYTLIKLRDKGKDGGEEHEETIE
ncbi:cation:proton antiporter [Mammaliicoccus lentus]|uniref:Na(+)/H(+) antiporter subunit A1 n=1 Tax=Mammaliicoccus lentus TaxID=42858 RepID=A0AAX3W6S4_MAMLE|nr:MULTISPECIES: Na+/H+ antiporter subunit A [Mammaliicoccus]HBV04966.1 Na+/H+ antiporter subunit A [Staphylococcus sp.]MBF0794491.1 Na+/H+ antiporter subunit A [Mammaliicoccus lentus]MBW0769736.1 Na+/H+ antiporter subunit A [Mammaliicoccus lentus]MCD2478568.1 Na+/H+ antiporter subunit A [Mammaliicoccus lentus]MCD2521965.1 Na+/H+ antiporter subunit A [Mammaliicoccus lentus]